MIFAANYRFMYIIHTVTFNEKLGGFTLVSNCPRLL